MTLEECKDKIAQDEGYHDWEDLHKELIGYDLSDYWLDIVKLYAKEKVKEALFLAANEVDHYISPNEGHESSLRICKSAIIALETELLNKIEKE